MLHHVRTTNLLERLFGKERRPTKVIPQAFGDRATINEFTAQIGLDRWGGYHGS